MLRGVVETLLGCRISHPRGHMQLDPTSQGHICTPMVSISALLDNLQPGTCKGGPVPWEAGSYCVNEKLWRAWRSQYIEFDTGVRKETKLLQARICSWSHHDHNQTRSPNSIFLLALTTILDVSSGIITVKWFRTWAIGGALF